MCHPRKRVSPHETAPSSLAAVLAAAFPGSALGAGLTARDLSPQASRGAVPTGVFQLVGVHWRGPGLVKYRTRNLAGRWSAWRVFSAEDALPDHGREQRATRGWRIASPFWTGASNAIQYRTVGRVARLRAYFVRSAEAGVSGEAGRSRGRAADHHPCGLARGRVDPSRCAVLRRLRPLRDRPPHGGLELVHEGAIGLDRSRDRALPRAGERLERHRLQLSRRQVRPGLRRPLRRDDQAGDRRACGGVQHGLRRDRADRRLQLDVDHACRAGRARLPDRLAARPRPRRSGFERRADLVRQPALRGGQGGHPACDLGAPRRLPDELSRPEPLRATPLHP